MSSKALRRHHEKRLREKRFKELKLKGWRVSHKHASVVGKYLKCPKNCSCAGCGNPRKYFNEKTIQERRADEEYK